ncbi:MAG: hypothetical protein D3909_06435 [Candidatus Electrothrix sp. ATG1]|nr:hypothetical protein [Candidatus Electrothrix sp. ATG1]MCI5207221.1 hypothetical protein [Candidatus Electrothrix sp. ATG2]
MKIYDLIAACCIALILFTSASGEVLYYHTDNFGTPMAMTDQSGEVVWRADELPFGEEYETEETPLSNSRRFLGKELDNETGLVYMGARYLDSKTGRFTQPDPVGLVDPATGKINQEMLLNPQRLNRYVYGLNNPYTYVDPDGEFVITGSLAVAAAIYAGEATIGLSAGIILGGLISDQLDNWFANKSNEGEEGRNQCPIPGTKPGKPTKGRSKQHEKPGDMDTANEDFDSLGPTDVKDIPKGGRTGVLPDRRRITVRPSKEGRPTVEIRKGKNKIKVRYGR